MSKAGSEAGGGGEEVMTPAVGLQSPHVTLNVSGQDGKVLSFRIRRSVKLRKLMEAYSDQLKVDMNTFVFLHDGVKVSPDDTPDELKLEDGAEIDAMLHQNGGSLR